METSHTQHMQQAYNLLAPEDATHVAVRSGSWSDPSTWAGGKVPDDSSSIQIPEGISILYDVRSSPNLEIVRVDDLGRDVGTRRGSEHSDAV